MKVKLVAGSEVDLVSPEELRTVLDEVVEKFRRSDSEHVRAELQAYTDGTGAVAIAAYQVPIGMKFRAARIVVSADGFSFAAKFTNAAGAVEVRRGDVNGQLVDGVNLNPSAAAGDQSVGIPWVEAYSSDNRPEFKNGEVIVVKTIAGPPNTNVQVLVEGDLYPDRNFNSRRGQ